MSFLNEIDSSPQTYSIVSGECVDFGTSSACEGIRESTPPIALSEVLRDECRICYDSAFIVNIGLLYLLFATVILCKSPQIRVPQNVKLVSVFSFNECVCNLRKERYNDERNVGN